MCGIFGIAGFQMSDLERGRMALNTLSHRGPDQWNEYRDESTYFGHRRLSILDLSENGRQPMVSPDGNVIITVNGEIYNFLALKNQLSLKYKFNSTSDSEVVLYGYIEWGIEGLIERIDGMYAFAIYDRRMAKIFIVRDRVGIKPIFYSQVDHRFMWASELKAIRDFYGKENLEMDYTALYDFFTYQYVPAPKTLYKNIWKLPPAHYLQYDITTGKIDVRQYWELEVKFANVEQQSAQEQLSKLVQKSVEEQLMSDVPIGFFLSGGMDSSTIVGVAASSHSNTSTFTIGFTNDPTDETPYADMVAGHFRTKHTKKILDDVSTARMFNKISEWFDEPFGDISCFPTFLVSQIAREKVTVVLSGDGGDELFGGYKWYNAFKLLQKFNLRWIPFARTILSHKLPVKGRIGRIIRRAEWLTLEPFELYTRLMGGLLKEEKSRLRIAWGIEKGYDDYWYFRKFYRPELPVVTRLRYLDFHTYLPDDILTKVDRVSMAVSLECRVPFLSKEIIEFVFSVPEDVLLPNGRLKGLMKNSFTKLLPGAIINREKKGFNIPVDSWRSELYGNYQSRHEKIVVDVFGIQSGRLK